MGYQQAAEAEAGGWPPQQQASQVGGFYHLSAGLERRDGRRIII